MDIFQVGKLLIHFPAVIYSQRYDEPQTNFFVRHVSGHFSYMDGSG